MKKTITFIIGIMGNGGAERVISILSKELVGSGNNVNIVTIYGSRTDYEIDARVNVYNIESKNKCKIIRGIERLYKLRNIFKKSESNILISFLADVNIYSLLAALFLDIKVIVSERNDPNSDPKNKYLRKLRDKIYLLSNGFVFQTIDARNYFNVSIKNRGTVIPNPIKLDLPNRFLGIRRKKIVSVCRLNEQKNIKMAINSFEKFSEIFPEYKYIIYGDGPLREELMNYIEKLGLSKKIYLPGFEKGIHEKIYDCKMLIISSNYEGISNAMLEALAIGLPVISTECPIGGAKMAIQNNENGILVPTGSTQELTNAMIKIVSDDDFSEKLSVNAVKIKAKFSPNIICEKWVKYINEILGDENE